MQRRARALGQKSQPGEPRSTEAKGYRRAQPAVRANTGGAAGCPRSERPGLPRPPPEPRRPCRPLPARRPLAPSPSERRPAGRQRSSLPGAAGVTDSLSSLAEGDVGELGTLSSSYSAVHSVHKRGGGSAALRPPPTLTGKLSVSPSAQCPPSARPERGKSTQRRGTLARSGRPAVRLRRPETALTLYREGFEPEPPPPGPRPRIPRDAQRRRPDSPRERPASGLQTILGCWAGPGARAFLGNAGGTSLRRRTACRRGSARRRLFPRAAREHLQARCGQAGRAGGSGGVPGAAWPRPPTPPPSCRLSSALRGGGDCWCGYSNSPF